LIKFIKFLYIFLFCLIYLLPSNSDGRGVGTSGSTMLKIGVGAKPASMGDATVASTDDVSSIYWNPAGLFQIRDSQFSAMHIEWFEDIRYEWLSFVQPIGSRSTIAVDVSYLYMGAISRTVESISEEYEEDGTFSPVDVAGRLALSAKIINGLMVGVSLQRIQSQINFDKVTKVAISDKIAQSMIVDIGAIYKIPRIPELSIGGCFQNFGGQTKAFITKKESIPFSLDLGMAYKAQMKAVKNQTSTEAKPDNSERQPSSNIQPGSLTIAFAVVFPVDESINARLGLEYRFSNGIAFRGGYKTGSGFDFPSGLSGGIGYDSSAYQIDYAFVPYGELGNTHRVSFTIQF